MMIYRLRQNPRAWNAKLDATLGELRFPRCTTKHALYTRLWGKEEFVVDVYVDDLIVTDVRAEDIDSFKLHTRPYIAFAMGCVSRFMEDLREDHWAVVKRLLRYVKGMVDQEIVFPKTGGSGLQLTVFSDADMAGDIDGRRRTSGVLVILGSAPISWL
ncbi:secreted RxLR effector protein 161-like [Miscanthus floridulus]|uniref:secreted RxLR effector protein 161-like n=1 Tax=Miscanthus floridulus TaxID=154761 RepID=UPI00345886BA